MFQLDTLKQFDPTKIDLTRLDVRKLEMPKFDMPKFDMPKFEMPKFEMPKFEMPTFPAVDVPFELPKMELPQVDLPIDRLAGLARDAAYVGVGAAVVAAKTADERRRTLTEQVTTQVRKLVDAVA
jgi:hypothetical protein